MTGRVEKVSARGKKAPSAQADSGLALDRVHSRILQIRDRRVLLDSDLAELYGTTTKRLNEQVRRNIDRFPDDFMFRMTKEEYAALRSHLATSTGHEQDDGKPQRGGRRYPPNVFTEHGAIMAATVLNTPVAVEAGIFVVRAFVKLRDYLASTARLAAKLEELERDIDAHDTAIRALVSELQKLLGPGNVKRHPVGFIIDK